NCVVLWVSAPNVGLSRGPGDGATFACIDLAAGFQFLCHIADVPHELSLIRPVLLVSDQVIDRATHIVNAVGYPTVNAADDDTVPAVVEALSVNHAHIRRALPIFGFELRVEQVRNQRA